MPRRSPAAGAWRRGWSAAGKPHRSWRPRQEPEAGPEAPPPGGPRRNPERDAGSGSDPLDAGGHPSVTAAETTAGRRWRPEPGTGSSPSPRRYPGRQGTAPEGSPQAGTGTRAPPGEGGELRFKYLYVAPPRFPQLQVYFPKVNPLPWGKVFTGR